MFFLAAVLAFLGFAILFSLFPFPFLVLKIPCPPDPLRFFELVRDPF